MQLRAFGLLGILAVIVILGGGIYYFQQYISKQGIKSPQIETINTPIETSEPLSYSQAGIDVKVSKEIKSFGYTADELKLMAEECGSIHEEGYFESLVAEFSKTSKIVYNFEYQGDSQEGNYIVTLLPNAMSYSSLDQFENDFGLCAAGGDAYPYMLNSNWLLFENSCGTGFDDSSGRAHGCEDVKKVIEPTLKLN